MLRRNYMDKSNKKVSLTFKIVLGLTIAHLVLFFILFFVFGGLAAKTTDPDLKGGIGDTFKYHFSDMGGLFAFNFHSASNVVYFSLSGLLYFFIFIAILYLIVGILLVVKKYKPYVFFGIGASILAIFIYLLVATGTPKYWAIINHRSPFENQDSLAGTTFAILLFGSLYILCSYALYFVSLFVTIKSPKTDEETSEEESEKTPEEEQSKETKAAPEIAPQPAPEQVSEPVANNEEEAVIFEEVDPSKVSVPESSQVGQTTQVFEEEKSQDKDDLKALLKEVVRDIVRDEIARNNANQGKNENGQNQGVPITGATFGGPLVVQYFNGGFASTYPNAEPVKEAKKEEPQKVAEQEEKQPVEEPKKEAPIVEEKSQEIIEEVVPTVEENTSEKKPIIRIPFTTRMLNADKEMQDNYNELKNEIMSYGVNSRVSNSGDTFRLHRVTYIKITIAGLSLKLYFALNPEDYKDSTLPIQDAGHKGIYEEIPLVFKVKSGLSMRRCKQLIQDVFDKNGLEQGEIGSTDWVEELKKEPIDQPDDD